MKENLSAATLKTVKKWWQGAIKLPDPKIPTNPVDRCHYAANRLIGCIMYNEGHDAMDVGEVVAKEFNQHMIYFRKHFGPLNKRADEEEALRFLESQIEIQERYYRN